MCITFWLHIKFTPWAIEQQQWGNKKNKRMNERNDTHTHTYTTKIIAAAAAGKSNIASPSANPSIWWETNTHTHTKNWWHGIWVCDAEWKCEMWICPMQFFHACVMSNKHIQYPIKQQRTGARPQYRMESERERMTRSTIVCSSFPFYLFSLFFFFFNVVVFAFLYELRWLTHISRWITMIKC